MWTSYKLLKYLLVFFLFITVTTCAPAKKNPYYQKRKTNSTHINASQLGKNRYFFSKDYQKKLSKKFKKK